jgi:magnesium transporter
MQRYDLIALPVVDDSQHLLGIITIDDLVDVIQSEASEDIQRLAATQPLDRAYLDTSIFSLTRNRICGLLLLFLTATLTGWVMAAYAAEIRAMVTLTIFIPMLIGTGGNAGSQTTATIIRALAVGDIDWGDVWRVWLHEVSVGFILGLIMGAIGFALAAIWISDLQLALIVGLSILCIVLWSTGAGSLLPLLATRLKVDPTVVSGPVMSTLVDATGLLIYFNIARIVLDL